MNKPKGGESLLDHYRDDGCAFWRACLACPFARCVEEWRSPWEGYVAQRNDLIRLMHKRGCRSVELARAFGLTRRSIDRVLAEGRQLVA